MKKVDKGTREAQRELQNREIEERLHHITNKILIMSGKGGVGKSSVAAHLAVALAMRGYRVGLMDVDLHGPSIPAILGLKGTLRPGGHAGKPMPVKYLPNMEVMSIGVLLGDKDAATIWRGPLKSGVIRQFISDIDWMDLDYMIVDSPPGTGDEPLTVAQTVPDAKAIVVTTPQELSLADVRKSINFCRKVNMEILGVVENMSGLKCPYCGKTIELFKLHGGRMTAEKEGLRLLASLPIEPEVVYSEDAGTMDVLKNGQLPFTQAINKMVDKVVELTASGSIKKIPSREQRSKDTKVLAIPVLEGKLSPHFGRCEEFAFIETQGKKIVRTEMRASPGHEPGVFPQWLYDQGADVVIVGGMGESAQRLLEEKGIEVIIGAPMDSPESLARQYLSNVLVTGSNLCDH